MDLDIVYPRCCGLDVHKKNVVACRIAPGADGKPRKAIRTFGTMTADLLSLADWLLEAEVTHVAMESTGVYWKPVYNLLEGVFTLLLVNAAHLKQVPGRKTDTKDSEWIATLLRHGLLSPSFVPERSQRELRELTRYRASLIRDRTAEWNRLQKTLEGANIKLGDVVADIQGKSSRRMLAGLVAGKHEAAELAQLAEGKLRDKIPELQKALTGCMGEHQRFLLARQLEHLEDLDRLLERVHEAIQERTRPFGAALARLQTIPGVGRHVAEALVAEIGTEMSRFPSAKHLASWAGLCPGNHQSAGKSRSGKTRKGSPWLRVMLVQAAKAAGRTKSSYLGAQYRRLVARRGKNKAAIAVAHSVLVIAYHLLVRETTYQDLGANYFDERDRQSVIRRSVRRLEALGCQVIVNPLRAAA